MLGRMQNTVMGKVIEYAVDNNTLKDLRSNAGERYGAIITNITSDALLMHRNNMSSMPFRWYIANR